MRQISYLRLFVLFLLLHRERQKSRFFKQDFKRAASGYGRYRLPSWARNSRFIFRLCRKLKLSGISANEFHLSISLSCAFVSASFKTFSKSFSFFFCILTFFPADFFHRCSPINIIDEHKHKKSVQKRRMRRESNCSFPNILA